MLSAVTTHFLLLHDYNTNNSLDTFQGMTQYRQADHCFMLDDGFDDVFSTDMDDWFKVCTLHFSAVLTVTSYRSYRKSPCQPG